jgi:hypothetical protein
MPEHTNAHTEVLRRLFASRASSGSLVSEAPTPEIRTKNSCYCLTAHRPVAVRWLDVGHTGSIEFSVCHGSLGFRSHTNGAAFARILVVVAESSFQFV